MVRDLSHKRNKMPFCLKWTFHAALISHGCNAWKLCSQLCSFQINRSFCLFLKNALLILHLKWPPTHISCFAHFYPVLYEYYLEEERAVALEKNWSGVVKRGELPSKQDTTTSRPSWHWSCPSDQSCLKTKDLWWGRATEGFLRV